MDKRKILLVEDDRNFGRVLMDYLTLHDYDVTLSMNGEEGLEELNKKNFDLCIFDVMMPKKDGFTMASEVAKRYLKTPWIFLTAKSLKEDVIKGLKLGADDYITKPFDSDVLLLKINAILNRYNSSEKPPEAILKLGAFKFDPQMRLLSSDNKEVRLSPKESALLALLAAHLNEVMPRSKALHQIWKEDSYFTTRSMDVYVAKLRKYLQADPAIAIHNIHGSGYSLRIG
jgi:two-component system, OmpR family, response regulator